MGEQLSSGTGRIICRVIGIAGLLCYFMTFAKLSIFGVTESYSGFGIIDEILSTEGKIDPEDSTILTWLILSFIGGLIGVFSSFTRNGSLVTGISDVFGIISLIFLKNAIEPYGFNTGTGWILAIICFVLAGVCAFFPSNHQYQMESQVDPEPGDAMEKAACPYCGAMHELDDAVCPYCGKRLQDLDSPGDVDVYFNSDKYENHEDK